MSTDTIQLNSTQLPTDNHEWSEHSESGSAKMSASFINRHAGSSAGPLASASFNLLIAALTNVEMNTKLVLMLE